MKTNYIFRYCALLCLSSCCFSWGRAQSTTPEVVESSFTISWIEHDPDAPVGQWGVREGFWLDEIPWGVFEVAWPSGWGTGQLLVNEEEWMPMPAASLTDRQRWLCQESPALPDWDVAPQGALAQWKGPLMRWNSVTSQFERLLEIQAAFGRFPGESLETSSDESGVRARNWPESNPLAGRTVVRMSIPADGLYRIDRDWMQQAGFNPDTLDPREIQVFGNGGELLPMDNLVDRPLGTAPVACWFDGEDDGTWDSEDALIFWGQGPHTIAFNASENTWGHERHPYEDVSWYFLAVDGADPQGRIGEAEPILAEPDTLVNRYMNVQFHEQELESPNRSGREWFGESFGYVNQRSWGFNMPFSTEAPAQVDVRVAAQSMGAPSSFSISAGDIDLLASPSYTSETSTSNVANLATVSGNGLASSAQGLEAENSRIEVDLQFQSGADGAIGWLDYIRVAQECHLKMAGSTFHFRAPARPSLTAEYALKDALATTQVWEITLPSQPRQMETAFAESEVRWKASADTTRRFVAFHGNAFPSPTVHGLVTQSNLHAVQRADLVIVTRPAYWEAAERLAQLHADEGMEVLLTTQRAVFDEFSSGSVDPTAIKMLMMLLRERALEGGWEPPQYLQLFGDGTFANRMNLEASPYVITYQSENSVSPTGSYVSDDYFGFLEDAYGEGIGDKLAIGVGRIPCSTLTEANAMVDKIEAYLGHPSSEPAPAGCLDENSGDDGTWRNLICLVSDDMDGNGGPTEIEHMVHSDEHAATLAANHPEYDVTKIYLDAYPQESTPGGERYPEAEVALDRQVRAGALIVNYIGHGGERGWSHERILNTTTIQEWDNLQRMPLFMTATCELARFDDPDVDSAGEMMVLNPKGGAVAMLTTTRVVFSGSNQQLNRAFYDIVLQDTGGVPLRLGDIARVTKNDPQVSNSSNKRNFSLLGDVALKLNYPKHTVHLTEVPDTLRALESTYVQGFVANAEGDTLVDFNGIVHVKVFDKRSQITTLNNDGAPNPHTFQVFRNVLFRGVASVTNGVFGFEFIVPRDIDYSFGNGRISAYAVSEFTDAHGATEDLIIGGVATDFDLDDTPPQVQLFLNDTTFLSGGITNDHPWLLARVFDAGGINSSGVGIGHDIKATLDGQSDESVVLNDHYTTDLNTFRSGTVRYPFEDLEDGPHTLEMVVWDVHNNKAEATLDFVVASSFTAAFGDVFAYPNPSAAGFDFSISHNQACADGTLVLEVFSSMGARMHRVEMPWHETGFRATDLRWDAQGSGGAPAAAAGVYVFRITLIPPSGEPVQYSDQLVVIRP